MDQNIQNRSHRAQKVDSKGFVDQIKEDYRICYLSRAASIICRKEVLNGKAKFGIGGAGKEVAQVALAKTFEKGDFRAGYYRDQTIMFSLGLLDIQSYFAQLYADVKRDPSSKGRQMVSHFATPFCDENNDWLDLEERYNITSDISSTAGQVARAVGLALASKKFRTVEELSDHSLNCGGNAVTFLNIGDGSTSEGAFLEAINAAAVLRIPMAVSVWDDGYAISVDSKYQTAKQSISRALEGFLYDPDSDSGMRIYTAKGWDYPGLCEMYLSTVPQIRESHVPSLYHIYDMTQPLGHSTSGSHTRYKSKKRLRFEEEMDCLLKMEEWMLAADICHSEEIERIKREVDEEVKDARNEAWKLYSEELNTEKTFALNLIKDTYQQKEDELLKKLYYDIKDDAVTCIAEVLSKMKATYYLLTPSRPEDLHPWKAWIAGQESILTQTYDSQLYAEGEKALANITEVAPAYEEDIYIPGHELLAKNFDYLFSKHSELFAFGEDVGKLGDVNQGMAGLQSKHGKKRIFDTGIREWTIVGQAIGMAMRGLKPIAEIQYLDYIPYAMAPLMDDLACLRYRSAGMQQSPCIIRTRGHRLEGIWHTGSPMGMLVNSLKGMIICVPRNMTKAAAMYNTLMEAKDPALVIECLNAYRKKEKLPSNLGLFKHKMGQIEVVREGNNVTIVTYGACVEVCIKASETLQAIGVSAEIIDVQTLQPFDTEWGIQQSIKKTNRVIFVDEDVPGGASAYMMQKVLEEQGAFDWLEVPPVTVTAKDHRTPYGDNGDYISKPQPGVVIDAVIKLMQLILPDKYGAISISNVTKT